MKRQKVLIAMSGGVDSSVAALMMKKKGFEVVGAFMKNYSDAKNQFGECRWREERRMAIQIASHLDIPLVTLDFEKQYKKEVVEKMFRNYKKGITPNPDIDCNQKIKFPLLIKYAKKIGADFVVTGHYARTKNSKLFRAKDETKDQSYFLYRIKKEELKKVLFPIGDYTKKQVREIAQKNKFPNYDKKGTVGICFIGKINLKNFLKNKIPQKKGKILNPDGEEIGTHDGIYYYTIGQRIGSRFGIDIDRNKTRDIHRIARKDVTLQSFEASQRYSSLLGKGARGKSRGVLAMKKWYVAKKDARKNIITAAPENHPLNFRKEIFLTNKHWINSSPKNNEKVFARIRNVGELLPTRINFKKSKILVTLNKAITGVSEGQAIVLYKGKEVLGGGEIRFR